MYQLDRLRIDMGLTESEASLAVNQDWSEYIKQPNLGRVIEFVKNSGWSLHGKLAKKDGKIVEVRSLSVGYKHKF